MSLASEPVGAELPDLWCRRLLDALRAAEEQVVVCPHRVGDGLERLAARWGSEGRVRTLRRRDLRNAEALRRALTDEAEPTSEAGWWVAIASKDDQALGVGRSLRSSLRPGERLLALVPEDEEETSRLEFTGSLDPRLRPAEIQQWAHRRWAMELDPDAAAEIGASCDGVLRRVELRLSEIAEDAQQSSVDLHRAESSPVAGTTATAQRSSDGPEIRLELLGVPRIRWIRRRHPTEGAEDLQWGYRGVLEVISALAVAPEMRLPGSELLERLWPNLDPEDARKRFYPAVSHSRRLFSDCDPSGSSAISSSGGVYRLNPEWRWDCDVVRLRDAVRRSAGIPDDLMQVDVDRDQPEGDGRSEEQADLRAALEAAWSSYRGEFLETLRSAWVRSEREDQRRNYLVVLRRLAVLRHAEPETAALEDVLRTILVADPIAEDVHVALMRLYARRGRADLVRRQYDRMCRVLMDDLGLQPMDRTVREVERLVAS